jgi:ssDNA-binding Zn-finger/Zn-ribbon topoisomerase 1
MVRCKNAPECSGSVGAWDGGSFYPAPHLKASRDLCVGPDGALVITCPLCHTQHRLELKGVRLGISKMEEVAVG